jgi:phosphate transport system permease protein
MSTVGSPAGISPKWTETDQVASAPLALEHHSRGRQLRDRLARVLVWLAFLVALAPLVWILWSVVSQGYHLLLDSGWWTHSQKGITARREGGGAVHAIQGTLLQGAVTAAISVPLAVLTAIYLV